MHNTLYFIYLASVLTFPPCFGIHVAILKGVYFNYIEDF
jgi:hypothetical protein